MGAQATFKASAVLRLMFVAQALQLRCACRPDGRATSQQAKYTGCHDPPPIAGGGGVLTLSFQGPSRAHRACSTLDGAPQPSVVVCSLEQLQVLMQGRRRRFRASAVLRLVFVAQALQLRCACRPDGRATSQQATYTGCHDSPRTAWRANDRTWSRRADTQLSVPDQLLCYSPWVRTVWF